MYRLPEKQIRVLRLIRSGVQFRKMKAYHVRPSTAYDAFKRAQRNLNAAIDIIEIAVRERWLDPKQIRRLRNVARKL